MKRNSFITKMDKSHLSTVSLYDEPGEKKYWLSKTPLERLQALEAIRQSIYAYDPLTTRLQRVLSITELT